MYQRTAPPAHLLGRNESDQAVGSVASIGSLSILRSKKVLVVLKNWFSKYTGSEDVFLTKAFWVLEKVLVLHAVPKVAINTKMPTLRKDFTVHPSIDLRHK